MRYPCQHVVHGGELPARRAVRAEVGVLTVRPEQMRAVVAALKRMYDYGDRRLTTGLPVHEAWLPDSRGRHVRVAAAQAPPSSAGPVLLGLIEEYQPATVVLVGTAAGVAPQVAVGDVVVSDRMVGYHARNGVRRRRPVPAVAATLGYRLNEFLTAVPLVQERRNGDSFRLHHGPIGAGDAVVQDAGAEIRRWLTQVNDKVLAVETEAAGVARTFHEVAGGALGRLTVRGIADTADQGKNGDFHDLAARHAAEVTAMMVPFLHPGR